MVVQGFERPGVQLLMHSKRGPVRILTKPVILSYSDKLEVFSSATRIVLEFPAPPQDRCNCTFCFFLLPAVTSKMAADMLRYVNMTLRIGIKHNDHLFLLL